MQNFIYIKPANIIRMKNKIFFSKKAGFYFPRRNVST